MSDVLDDLREAISEGAGELADLCVAEITTLRSHRDELLDALENLVIGIGMGWDLEGLIEVSNAAIAKATGEQS